MWGRSRSNGAVVATVALLLVAAVPAAWHGNGASAPAAAPRDAVAPDAPAIPTAATPAGPAPRSSADHGTDGGDGPDGDGGDAGTADRDWWLIGSSDEEDLVAAEAATGQHAKVYGNVRWDLDGDGSVTGAADLGDAAEWDGHGTDAFDAVRFEPAYDRDARISGAAVEAISTGLTIQYHPTFWLPAEEARLGNGSDAGLFDADGDGDLDYAFIFDEDHDPTLDADTDDDHIDLIGPDDGRADVEPRNNDTSAGHDLYFPAAVARYAWVGHDAADAPVAIEEGDEITFPLSGLGGPAGLHDDVVVPDRGSRTVLVQDISDADGAPDGDDAVRFEVRDVVLEEGETARLWDFQVTIDAIDDVVGAPDDVRARIDWLGDHEDPEPVGGDVTAVAGDVLSANRTSTSTTTGDCDGDSGKPTLPATRPWYVCVATVSATSDPPRVVVTVGRLFSDRGSDGVAATAIVNGALYSVADVVVADGALERFVLDQAVPIGDDLEVSAVKATLKGVGPADALPVAPPFHGDHVAIGDLDVEPERNPYGFLREADVPDDGLEQDDLEFADDHRTIDDRLVARSALEVRVNATGREGRLLAHRHAADPGQGAWRTEFRHVQPDPFALIELPDDRPAVVEAGLLGGLPGLRDRAFDPLGGNGVHLVDGALRLHGADLTGDHGDRLTPEPALVTAGDVRAGGSDAALLVGLEIGFEPFALFEDVDRDGEVDLNVLTDEEEQAAGGDARDPDSIHHTIDADGDNLFDVQGHQNNDDDEGDIYAPAIRQTYTHTFLDETDLAPTVADLPASGINLGPDPSDSGTKATFSLTTDTHDGGGLDSADLDGDGDEDGTFVQAIDTGADTDQSEEAAGAPHGLIQLESGALSVRLGNRAQLLDYEVEVQATDTVFGPSARLSIYQVVEAGVTNDDVATFAPVLEGEFVGVRHNYATGEATALGPAECIDVDGATAAGGCADGDGEADMDFYVRVDSITSDNVTLVIGTFLPGDLPRFVDGQMYRSTGATGDGLPGTATTVHTITLETLTPIGDNVLIQEPPIEVAAIGHGDFVPLLAPFNRDHDILDVNGVPLEEDVYGALDPDAEPDGDDAVGTAADRVSSVGALDLRVASLGVPDGLTRVRADSQAPVGEGRQVVNGVFTGLAGSSTTGPAAGGWPDAGFANLPDDDGHSGSVFVVGSFDGIEDGGDRLPNTLRGIHRYVALDLPSGHGDYLLASARLPHVEGPAVDDGAQPDSLVAAFTVSPAKPTTLDTVQFTDHSVVLNGTILAWSWNFGDGNMSTAQNPSHAFAQNGTFEVTLTVADDDGDTDTASTTIEVVAPPSEPRNLTAEEGPGLGEVHLAWFPPDGDGGAPVTAYAIHRGPSPDDLELVAVIGDATEYTDEDRSLGVEYHYRVAAVNVAGPGPLSDAASALGTGPPDCQTDVGLEDGHVVVEAHCQHDLPG